MSFLESIGYAIGKGVAAALIDAWKEQQRVYSEQEATDEDNALIDSAAAMLSELHQAGHHDYEPQQATPACERSTVICAAQTG